MQYKKLILQLTHIFTINMEKGDFSGDYFVLQTAIHACQCAQIGYSHHPKPHRLIIHFGYARNKCIQKKTFKSVPSLHHKKTYERDTLKNICGAPPHCLRAETVTFEKVMLFTKWSKKWQRQYWYAMECVQKLRKYLVLGWVPCLCWDKLYKN